MKVRNVSPKARDIPSLGIFDVAPGAAVEVDADAGKSLTKTIHWETVNKASAKADEEGDS